MHVRGASAIRGYPRWAPPHDLMSGSGDGSVDGMKGGGVRTDRWDRAAGDVPVQQRATAGAWPATTGAFRGGDVGGRQRETRHVALE
eukprot:ctg_512.g230